jgi:hypothetical protein
LSDHGLITSNYSVATFSLDDNNSTNNDTKHLKLSYSIINGLTSTEIMMGDSKARKMAKRWFQNANKGTSNQADSLVKD